ncbi:MAG TPA: acetyltransferase [Candidatus Limnocylindria bacterium]|nr:acetyltransferase [Candidatus Limnocylindria bacterium]
MRRDLVILGSSGLAREVAMVAEQVNAREHRWRFLGFVGATMEEKGRDLGLGSVLGDDAWFLSQQIEADLVVGIGYPKVRAKVLQRYLEAGARFRYPNLVHPHASLDFRRVELGQGNVVTAGVAMTCDIRIADFNLFNLNVTVGHDDVIGSFNVFNPSVNLSGSLQIGDRVLAGTGSQILENLKIGSDATIGAGAVVRADVEAGTTVVGIPAKPLPRKA